MKKKVRFSNGFFKNWPQMLVKGCEIGLLQALFRPTSDYIPRISDSVPTAATNGLLLKPTALSN